MDSEKVKWFLKNFSKKKILGYFAGIGFDNHVYYCKRKNIT